MRTRILRAVGKLLASLWTGRGSNHPPDRELVRILVNADGGDPVAADAHLAGCARCAARVRDLQTDLDRIAATAESAFEDAMPAWRQVRQRRRIMRRIQRAAARQGSARILRFPTPGIPAAAGAHALRRRLSLAAAACLLVTVGIVQLIDGRRQPSGAPRSAADVAPSQASIGPPAGQPQAVADEQFMRELEEALTSSRVTPLVALDEMTPRVRDVGIDIR